MKMILRLAASWLLVSGTFVTKAPPAVAATVENTWPAARPIRMVIPGGAGSGTDIFARIIGARLAQELKQTIVYDNRPGANGIIGNDQVAKAAPDGYTVLFSNASAIAVNAAVQQRLPYEALRDLVPVSQVGAGGVLLVVTPGVPARDMQSLVQFIRARPGKLTYGTWGTGSTGHLSMEALRSTEGLSITHIPYKTMGQLLTDLQGGILQIAFVDAASPLPLIKAGRLVPIGITGSFRAPSLPALPTMQEQGFNLGPDGWYGLFVPAGTPQAIVRRLHDETNRVLGSPAVTPTFLTWNMAAPPLKSSSDFAQTVRGDIEQWRRVARIANFSLD